MDTFLFFDFLIKLFYVIVALIIMVAALRAFDKYIGVDFKDSFKKVLQDEKAFSLYIGLRFIGVSILISSII